jgi:hypothetical protein
MQVDARAGREENDDARTARREKKKMQRSIIKLSSYVPGVGRRDHGDPVGGVGPLHAGDGDLEERLVGDRACGADIDGQVGARRVDAGAQRLPVHRPELRLARVALAVQQRRRRRRRRARDGGAAQQAEEREREERRELAGASLDDEEGHPGE